MIQMGSMEDDKCRVPPRGPSWGDVVLATGERGALRWDITNGVVLEAYIAPDKDMTDG